MSQYGTKLKEVFAAVQEKHYYENAVADKITNKNHTGEVEGKATVLNVLTIKEGGINNYTGADVSWEDLEESNSKLVTDQEKYYAFKVKNIDKLKSYVKDPQSGLLNSKLKLIEREEDKYVLSTMVASAAAGNRIGTSYTTGTVAVAATTGVVTGTGTTFTSAMVGLPFTCAGLVDADGNQVWYRIKTYTSATSITIEDDLDDEASAYTGGAITSGATYEIQAASAKQATASNIYEIFTKADELLNVAEMPIEDRFVVVSPAIKNIILNSNKVIAPIDAESRRIINRAYVGELAGFQIYVSNCVSGNGTSGYDCVFGNKLATTFARALVENDVTEKLENNFGTGFKGLFVYGAKVPDLYKKGLVTAKLSI